MRPAPTRILTLLLPLAILIASCNPIPTKEQPAAYAQALVFDAIRFYNENGREATVKHFSSFDQVDGQWYVFMFDENNVYIASPYTALIGRDLSKLVDVNGNKYGEHIASTTTAGKWISYAFLNPQTNEQQRKNAWFVRHDGLVFASGYYE